MLFTTVTKASQIRTSNFKVNNTTTTIDKCTNKRKFNFKQ